VPTFESVREKIETRYGTAIGASELDAESPEGRTVEEQYDARKRAGAERLAEIASPCAATTTPDRCGLSPSPSGAPAWRGRIS
jgi:phage shock protein A